MVFEHFEAVGIEKIEPNKTLFIQIHARPGRARSRQAAPGSVKLRQFKTWSASDIFAQRFQSRVKSALENSSQLHSVFRDVIQRREIIDKIAL